MILPIGSIVENIVALDSSLLLCDGRAVSRTVYTSLFALIGVKYGDGDSATTFNLPDLRSETIRGFDNSGTTDLGRV